MKRQSHPDCEVCRARLAAQRAYNAAMRARWKALGLCPRCGKARQRFAECHDCRVKAAKVQKRRWLTRKRAKVAA